MKPTVQQKAKRYICQKIGHKWPPQDGRLFTVRCLRCKEPLR